MVRVGRCPGSVSIVVDLYPLIRKTIGPHSSADESRLDRLWTLLPRGGTRAHHSSTVAVSSPFPTDAQPAPPLHHHVCVRRWPDRPIHSAAAHMAMDCFLLAALRWNVFCATAALSRDSTR